MTKEVKGALSTLPSEELTQKALALVVGLRELETWKCNNLTAISGDLLSAVISIRCILGFRKDNPNVFSMLVQNSPITSGIKCICY